MYVLYTGNRNYSSCSLRTWSLMRILDIPFEERLMPFREDGGRFFRTFSPSARVPCLHDGDRIIWDTISIFEYLAERHAGVWPGDGAARGWARSASAEMHADFPRLRETCTMNCGLRAKLHEVPQQLQSELDRLRAIWEEGLDIFGGPYLAGSMFTAADASFVPVAFRYRTYGLDSGPVAGAYLRRLLELPEIEAWDRDAVQEVWREPHLDAATSTRCTIIEDRRAAPESADQLASSGT